MKATTSEIYIMHDTVNIMDDRGDLDLTKQIDNLKETVYGFKLLVAIQKQEIWNLKEQVAEVIKTELLNAEVLFNEVEGNEVPEGSLGGESSEERKTDETKPTDEQE